MLFHWVSWLTTAFIHFLHLFNGDFISCAVPESLISLDVEVFNYSYEHQCQLFDIYTFLVSVYYASAAARYDDRSLVSDFFTSISPFSSE